MKPQKDYAAHISYSSVAMVKHQDQRQLKEEGVYSGSWKSPSLQGRGTAASSKHSHKNRKLEDHIFNNTTSSMKQRTNWK